MNKSDKIILEFPILYRGWECDTKGWIMQRRDGSKYIKLTSHGSPYVAAKEDLEAKIKEYQDAIKQTERAINKLIMQKQPNPPQKGSRPKPPPKPPDKKSPAIIVLFEK